MPRTTEFDRSQVRDRCLELFWQHGYQATSVADLLNATGLSSSSFYRAFHDKRTLFAECLDVFASRTKSIVTAERRKGRPLEALRAFFVQTVAGVRSEREQCGCMLVNTVTELAGVDVGLAQAASHHLASVERLFARGLREAGFAQRRADQLAGMLMLMNEGIRVAARRAVPARKRLSSVEGALSLIEAELLARGSRVR